MTYVGKKSREKRAAKEADLSLHKSAASAEAAPPAIASSNGSECVCQKASGNTQKNLHH